MTLKNKMLMKRLLVHLQQVLRLLLPLLSMLLMLLVRSVVVRLLSMVPVGISVVRQVCLRCLTVAISVCLDLMPEPRECWTLHLDPCLCAPREFEHFSIGAFELGDASIGVLEPCLHHAHVWLHVWRSLRSALVLESHNNAKARRSHTHEYHTGHARRLGHASKGAHTCKRGLLLLRGKPADWSLDWRALQTRRR